MKRFVGGNDGRVFVVNPGVREIGVFEWGKKPLPSGRTLPPSEKCRALAKALLLELLDDQGRADELYVRFMHRTVAEWKYGAAWTKTEEQLLRVVEAIETAAAEAVRDRAAMARELPAGGFQVLGNIPVGGHDKAAPVAAYSPNDTAPDNPRRR